MSTYFILFAIVFLVFLVVVVLLNTRHKKNIPESLYFEALRKENMGEFEVALHTYESALDEVTKFRFHDDLKQKIEDKIRLMHTVIEYQHNISFSSFNNPAPARQSAV